MISLVHVVSLIRCCFPRRLLARSLSACLPLNFISIRLRFFCHCLCAVLVPYFVRVFSVASLSASPPNPSLAVSCARFRRYLVSAYNTSLLIASSFFLMVKK